jgi:hypothetical protein
MGVKRAAPVHKVTKLLTVVQELYYQQFNVLITYEWAQHVRVSVLAKAFKAFKVSVLL